MSVQKIERPPRGNESPRRKHYDYKVRWRHQGKQPSIRVTSRPDAHALDEYMKVRPMATADAKAWLRDRLPTLDDAPATSTAPSLRDAWTEWIERPGLRQGSRNAYRARRDLCGEILDMPVDLITHTDVSKAFRLIEVENRAAPTTMVNTRDALLAVLGRHGVDTTAIVEDLRNMDGGRLLKPIYLADDRVDEILAQALTHTPELWVPLRLTLDTAGRWGEIFGLVPRWVDTRGESLRFEQQISSQVSYQHELEFIPLKTKRSRRRLPITKTMGAILDDVIDPNQQDLPIFRHAPRTWMSHGAFQYQWRKLRVKVGMPELRFHDIRHTAVMRWRDNGVDLATASQALGHSSVKVTLETYGEWNSHADDALRNAQLGSRNSTRPLHAVA